MKTRKCAGCKKVQNVNEFDFRKGTGKFDRYICKCKHTELVKK